MDFVHFVLVEPTLAAHFARHSGATLGDGLGERLAQIEIAADTVVVVTIEPDHGLVVVGVERAFDFAVFRHTIGLEIGKLRRQRLQFPELLREAH